MSLRFVILLFIFAFIGTLFTGQSAGTLLDKEKLYSAMSSEDLQKIDAELKKIEEANNVESEAFEGALLMKKAGLIKGAKAKLSVFKEGHKKLEASIKTDSANAEYRFLRLMIQENAPKILGYNKDLRTDQSILISKFKSLTITVQEAVLAYCKKSKVLKATDFK